MEQMFKHPEPNQFVADDNTLISQMRKLDS
jgi:hypothetical protein